MVTNFRKEDRVRVLPKMPNGEDHPQAGKTGTVTETLGVATNLFAPRALIRIDAGFEDAGNIMIVGFGSLEKIN